MNDLIKWLIITHLISMYFYWNKNTPKLVWFKLHCIVNIIAMIFSAQDLFSYIVDPMHPIRPAYSTQPMNIIMALHIYHMLESTLIFGHFKLNMLDWIHHIVMCLILIIPYYDPEAIEQTNSVIFFISGLPGAIDYWLISMVQEGKLKSIQEKKINNYLNVYIRSPGILYVTTIGYARFRANMYTNTALMTISTAVLFWNAQFFMQIVVDAYGRARNQVPRSKPVRSQSAPNLANLNDRQY